MTTTPRNSQRRRKLFAYLSAAVFAFAPLASLGCTPSAKPATSTPAAVDKPATPVTVLSKTRAADPAPAQAVAHAVSTEWYAPREDDFRPEYDRDAANQGKESWNEYWSWVKTFYTGNLFSSGWTAQGMATLRGVQSEKTRDELRADLNELGRRVAAEWSKDNGVRQIDTAGLRVFGNRLTRATRLDDGSGQAIQKEIDAIRAEVNAKLAGR